MAQDQELFLEAYSSFKTKSGNFNSFGGLQEWFGGVERLPDSWPMARGAHSSGGKGGNDCRTRGVVFSCDGSEGVLTWCFFVLFVLTQKITTTWRVSLDSLVAPCFALV